MKSWSGLITLFLIVMSCPVLAEKIEYNVTLNPCFQQRGVPYRKYFGFALNDSGALLKFKCESCSPKIEHQAYGSVEDFFKAKRILVTKEAGSLTPVCSKNSSEYVEKIVKISVDIASGSTPQPRKPGRRRGSSGGEGDHFASINTPLNSVFSYYGIEVNDKDDQGLLDPFVESGDVKAFLSAVLSSAHVQSKGAVDRLIKNCSEYQQSTGEMNESCMSPIIFSYVAARHILFGRLHLDKGKVDGGYSVKDVYCQRDYTEQEFAVGSGPGPYKIPNHEVLNTEHTWPQSRFNKSLGLRLQIAQKTDLHHLFPSDNPHNGTRGNRKFAELREEGVRSLPCKGNRRGQAKLSGLLVEEGTDKEEIYYEPPKAHRGNIARALFYFSTRYQIKISAIEEFYLRKWHKEDRVDIEEVLRAEEIYRIQGTRNPYIDFPDIVYLISDF